MSVYEKSQELAALGLGKPTEYVSHYTPDLLQAVPRALNRKELGVAEEQPFFGVDIWNGYELSWLNNKGKPVVALMRCFVPAWTPNIIESKSFKLYLNSFNQTKFAAQGDVLSRLVVDLSKTAGGDVRVELFAPDEFETFSPCSLPGKCIDDLDIEIDQYSLTEIVAGSSSQSTNLDGADSGCVIASSAEEVLHSHLLKSNCLITNQPDWASLIIDYRGQKINHESLLRYLISFRMHNEFHEQCVERIYMDLWRCYKLERLSVHALYTRRGGLDINPYRSSGDSQAVPHLRINRQ